MGNRLCCFGRKQEDLPSTGSSGPEQGAQQAEQNDVDSLWRPNSKLAVEPWLRELGLQQYLDAFDAAGYHDWDVLGALDEHDLQMIELHGNVTILPGHRKKLLLASRQLCTPQHRRRRSHAARGSGDGANLAALALAINRITPLHTVGSSRTRTPSTATTPRQLSSAPSRASPTQPHPAHSLSPHTHTLVSPRSASDAGPITKAPAGLSRHHRQLAMSSGSLVQCAAARAAPAGPSVGSPVHSAQSGSLGLGVGASGVASDVGSSPGTHSPVAIHTPGASKSEQRPAVSTVQYSVATHTPGVAGCEQRPGVYTASPEVNAPKTRVTATPAGWAREGWAREGTVQQSATTQTSAASGTLLPADTRQETAISESEHRPAMRATAAPAGWAREGLAREGTVQQLAVSSRTHQASTSVASQATPATGTRAHTPIPEAQPAVPCITLWPPSALVSDAHWGGTGGHTDVDMGQGSVLPTLPGAPLQSPTTPRPRKRDSGTNGTDLPVLQTALSQPVRAASASDESHPPATAWRESPSRWVANSSQRPHSALPANSSQQGTDEGHILPPLFARPASEQGTRQQPTPAAATQPLLPAAARALPRSQSEQPPDGVAGWLPVLAPAAAAAPPQLQAERVQAWQDDTHTPPAQPTEPSNTQRSTPPTLMQPPTKTPDSYETSQQGATDPALLDDPVLCELRALHAELLQRLRDTASALSAQQGAGAGPHGSSQGPAVPWSQPAGAPAHVRAAHGDAAAALADVERRIHAKLAELQALQATAGHGTHTQHQAAASAAHHASQSSSGLGSRNGVQDVAMVGQAGDLKRKAQERAFLELEAAAAALRAQQQQQGTHHTHVPRQQQQQQGSHGLQSVRHQQGAHERQGTQQQRSSDTSTHRDPVQTSTQQGSHVGPSTPTPATPKAGPHSAGNVNVSQEVLAVIGQRKKARKSVSMSREPAVGGAVAGAAVAALSGTGGAVGGAIAGAVSGAKEGWENCALGRIVSGAQGGVAAGTVGDAVRTSTKGESGVAAGAVGYAKGEGTHSRVLGSDREVQAHLVSIEKQISQRILALRDITDAS